MDSLLNTWLQEQPTVLQNCVQHSSVATLGLTDSKLLPNVFNHTVPHQVKVTDQKSSGRCWLFATCNLIRMVAMANVPELASYKDFELSQNYLFFFDKFERYHRLLRYWLQIQAQPVELKARYMHWIVQDPLGDGGQFDMAKEIVKKYGIVPKFAYPETHHSGATVEMNKLLKIQLINDFEQLLQVQQADVNTNINTMMQRVYSMLVSFLGKPPTRFQWEFESSKEQRKYDMTPLEFLALTKFNGDEYVSVVNDPRREHAYNKYYRVKFLGNVRDSMVGWINVPIERLLALSKQMIDQGHPVWFGCDVSQERDRASGNHNVGIIDTRVVGLNDTISKEQKLRNYLALPNHAMLITGYNDVDTVVNRWKIENSWGTKSGADGYLLMSDSWMRLYTFQALVKKSILSAEELLALEDEMQILQPWDPLGTLA